MNYFRSARKQLILFLIFICSGQISNAQESTELTAQQTVKKAQLDSLFDDIYLSYYDQNYVQTIQLGEKALELDYEEKFQPYYIRFASYLGNSLLQVGDTVQSKRIFELALEKAKQINDNREIVGATVDLANVYITTGNLVTAVSKYKAALPLVERNDTVMSFIINNNLGETYLELLEVEQSRPYILKSYELARFLNDPAYESSAELLAGKLDYFDKKYNDAINHFKSSIRLAEKSSYKEVLIEAYNYYSQSEAELGNYQKAYDLKLLLDQLNEEKFEVERVKAVQNARAEFEVNEIKRAMDARLEAERLNGEIKRERDRVSLTSIALALAAILIILLVIGYSQRKKMNKDLLQKNFIYLKEKKKSEGLLAARNALFSRISHELRTPMYGIVGISNLLLDDKSLENKHFENITSLKYSADYLLSLINNVLEMNKLNRSSNTALKIQSFNLKELCFHAVESAKYISLEASNVFKIDLDPEVQQTYLGDSVKLMQVLINLLGNSNKFTQDGIIELQVRMKSSSDGGHTLLFKVTDNGKGIPQKKMASIFDETKFIETNEEYEGTGLGIPISNKILKMQKSELHIESKVNEGTSIYFEIFYKLDQNNHTQQKLDTQNNVNVDLTGKKILIVEDNKINQMVTKKIIESLNGTFDIASSGMESVDMVRNNSYDLILMDINMPPGIDGFEATRLIREFNKDIPIVALTAVEQIEIENRMKSFSMNAYLIKPFKKDEFLNLVHSKIKT